MRDPVRDESAVALHRVREVRGGRLWMLGGFQAPCSVSFPFVADPSERRRSGSPGRQLTVVKIRR